MGLKEEAKASIKKHLLEPLKARESILCERGSQHESISRDCDIRKRPQYHRDYTRIMYSTAFRRLQGKMQLLGIEDTKFYRNRLTHSLEVAQIARSIAEDIGYTSEEVYVVEACSLAHDIGNPPFGHFGEIVLTELLYKDLNYFEREDQEGFEGNAQTLRIVTTLQQKDPVFKGLDLTNRTLLGLVKYYKTYSEDKKKYLYREDFGTIKAISEKVGIEPKTLDAQIMDIADNIAYAAHDLEDALLERIFTIDEFLTEFKRKRYYEKRDEKDFDEKSYKAAIIFLLKSISKAKRKAKGILHKAALMEYNTLFTKELTSIIIHDLIEDIDLMENKKEIGFKNFNEVAVGLKKVTFECVTHMNNVKLYEQKGRKVLEGLFDVYINNKMLMPVEYRYKEDDSRIIKNRKVIDYLSGMMDSFAISEYKKYYGNDSYNHLCLEGK